MKKGVLVLVLILSTLFLISFVSASFWDLFGITGKAITDTNNANLVAYYPFDINANDQSGHANNLGCSSVSTCPGLTTGKISKAYNFDGVNDQYTDSSTSSLDINQYSTSAWIKTSNKQGRMTIVEFTKSSANGNNRRGIAISGNNNLGKPIIYYGNDKMKIGNTGDLRDGNWHHIVVIYDSTDSSMYVDGVSATLGAEDTTNSGSFSSQLKIGNSLTSQENSYFNGTIDDVRIYNKALSYSEVQEVYKYGISTTCTPSWSCTSWSTCSNGQQTRTCSDNNNCGTTSGKPATSQSCTNTPVCGNGICESGETSSSCPSDCQTIEVNRTCIDKDNGLNYYSKAQVINSSFTLFDVCSNSNNLNEAYCGDLGYIAVQNYACPNGCLNGACLQQNTSLQRVDGCYLLSDSLKSSDLFKDGQDSNGDKVYYNEGDKIFKSGYAVVDDGNGGSIWELISIYNDTSSATGSEIRFYNKITTQWRVSKTTNWGTGTIDFGVKNYIFIFRDNKNAENDEHVVLDFLHTSATQYMSFDSCVIPTQTCTDSDGGINYYVKGEVNDTNQNGIDECLLSNGWGYTSIESCSGDNCYVHEYYCQEDSTMNAVINICSNGCYDGACLESNNTQINKTCLDLVAQVKNPTSFENNGVKYDLNWNSSYSGNWRDGESYSEYDAGWTLSYNDGDNYKYGYLDKSTLVFDNPDFNAIDVMDDFTQYEVCQVHTYGSSDWNQDYRVYVCNWNVFDKGVSVDRYSYENREIVWASDNVILRMSYGTGQYLTDEQLSQIIEKGTVNFLNALINNRGRYLGWENFNIDWPFDIQIFDALVYCPSDIPEDTCSPYWECVTEPAICPEYGTQQQTCRDASCGNEDITSIISCNPGICSGCLVPKWLDSKSFADNKCIPYGFRFENQIGFGNETVTNQENAILSVAQATNDGEINLSISPNGVATLHVGGWGNQIYTFSKGDKVEIDVSAWGGDAISASLFVNDVVYNAEDYGKSYIDVSFEITYNGRTIKTANSYCEIDGNIKVQKPSVPGQEWPKCQNNYECESNVCSGGECIPVSQYIKEGGRLKGFFFNLLCNIAYPINEDKRAQCVANFLGA